MTSTIIAYRDRETGQYPLSDADVRQRFDGGLPADLTQAEFDLLGVDPVFAAEPPAYDPATQMVTESPPAKKTGKWVQTWTVTALPPPPEPDPTEAWIPLDTMRERAEALGIWAALAGYLAQNPELMLKVLTLRSDRVNPEDPDLLAGLAACEVPAEAQAILLAPMT